MEPCAPCEDCCGYGSWTPCPDAVCLGDPFTQKRVAYINYGSSCPDIEREAVGTSESEDCGWTDWTPDPDTQCLGEYFTQTRTNTITDEVQERTAVGTLYDVIPPVYVYRTGGISITNPKPGVPGQVFSTECEVVLIGTIEDVTDTVTVSWGGGVDYSSVEVQAVDSCGNCVYYANKAVNGNNASITVSFADLAVEYPFGGGGIWCPNPCPW